VGRWGTNYKAEDVPRLVAEGGAGSHELPGGLAPLLMPSLKISWLRVLQTPPEHLLLRHNPWTAGLRNSDAKQGLKKTTQRFGLRAILGETVNHGGTETKSKNVAITEKEKRRDIPRIINSARRKVGAKREKTGLGGEGRLGGEVEKFVTRRGVQRGKNLQSSGQKN